MGWGFPAPGTRLLTAIWLAGVLLLPATAGAQRDTFVQALLDFHGHLAALHS